MEIKQAKNGKWFACVSYSGERLTPFFEKRSQAMAATDGIKSPAIRSVKKGHGTGGWVPVDELTGVEMSERFREYPKARDWTASFIADQLKRQESAQTDAEPEKRGPGRPKKK